MTQILFKQICERFPVDPDALQSWSERDPSLFSTVTVTLTQLISKQTPMQIKFDRSLATRGEGRLPAMLAEL